MSTERLARLVGHQEEARKERESLVEKRAAIVQTAEDEGREDLNDAEDTEFRGITAEIADLDSKIAARDERITELADEEKRAGNAAAAVRRAQLLEGSVRVKHESRTYEKRNGNSYLQDLAKAQINGDLNAQERLQRHAAEVATDPEFNTPEMRSINRTDGTGGYFVPPLWMMQEWVHLARAGRPTANLCNMQPLPPGTDSINIPKLLTGTATAIQTADNQSVQSTDLSDTSVSAGVKTIAGQQDVAIQALEQSPLNFDEIIFTDLMADYATKTDLQVISGSNGTGQVKGIINASGINTTTYTSTSPTVAGLYSKIADAIQKIHTNRFAAPTVIVMHPRRWAWILAATDTTNRPLVVPGAQGPWNALASFNGVVSEQVVGDIQGLPVVTDPSITITDGSGTNQDQIIVMRNQDLYLWESGVRSRVLPDVGSGTLTVRLQVYGYLAFTAERQPASITLITGTGLTAPTF